MSDLILSLILAAAAIFAPSLSGSASWYSWHPGEAAAGPGLRAFLGRHWRGQSVTVCSSRCITVTLTDYCGCPHAVIDLDVGSFERLAPRSVGVIHVMITKAVEPQASESPPIAPPTDALE